MKANRKFIKGDDEAVSPVIAVILMVAITVVLAATVYVWVSGFGAGGQQPAKNVALSGSGAISSGVKTYVVSSASPGLKWNDLKYTLDGNTLTYEGALTTADDVFCIAEGGSTCTAGATIPTTVVDAGDMIKIKHSSLSGKTLRLLDSQANSVILTQVVG